MQKGFTLLELLIAITASVIIAGISLGIFKNAIDSQKRVSANENAYYRRIQLIDLVDDLIQRQSGVFYGNQQQLVFLSDLNFLGYGREMVYLGPSGPKDDTFSIRLVPLLTRENRQEPEETSLQHFYTFPGQQYPLSYSEGFKGFKCQVSYKIAEEDNIPVNEQQITSCLITLHEEPHNEWYISKSF